MMSKPVTNMLPYALAFIAGLAICLFIMVTSGRKEAWDSPAYFTVGHSDDVCGDFRNQLLVSATCMALGAEHGDRAIRGDGDGGRVGFAVAAGDHRDDGGVADATGICIRTAAQVSSDRMLSMAGLSGLWIRLTWDTISA